MNDIIICSFETQQLLAQAVAHAINASYHCIKIGSFSDGEYTLALPECSFRYKTVFFIQATYPQPASATFAFISAIHMMREQGALFVHAICPYLSFLRQDRQVYGRFPIGQSLISLLDQIPLDTLSIVEPHNTHILRTFSKVPVHIISLDTIFIEYIRTLAKSRHVCIVAPDHGAYLRADAIARGVQAPLIGIMKQRDNQGMICDIAVLAEDVRAHTAIIIDDICDTGRTAGSIAQVLTHLGVAACYGFFVHPIFSEDAISYIMSSGFSHIFVTDSIGKFDTVPHLTTIPLSPIIAMHIMQLLKVCTSHQEQCI